MTLTQLPELREPRLFICTTGMLVAPNPGGYSVLQTTCSAQHLARRSDLRTLAAIAINENALGPKLLFFYPAPPLQRPFQPS